MSTLLAMLIAAGAAFALGLVIVFLAWARRDHLRAAMYEDIMSDDRRPWGM